jgi:ABC-type lipoprotein release transport system permease subunit
VGAVFEIALTSLREPRARTRLLVIAMALVSLFFVVLLAFLRGLEDSVLRQATVLITGHVNVSGFFKHEDSDVAPIVLGPEALEQLIRSEVPELDFMVRRHRDLGRVVSEKEALDQEIVGIDIETEARLLGSLPVEGDLDELKEPGRALIFANQAKRLDVRLGDVLTLAADTYAGHRNRVEVVVAAIARDLGPQSEWHVYVPEETARELYQLEPGATGALQLYLHDHGRSAEVMARLEKLLAERGQVVLPSDPRPYWAKKNEVAAQPWSGQKLNLTTWRGESSSTLSWIITAFQGVTLVLVLVLLLVSVVGIASAMHVSLRERWTEIGILRSLGMQRRGVLLAFLLEGLVLALAAGCIGSLGGIAISWWLELSQVEMPPMARSLLLSETIHMVPRFSDLALVVAALAFAAAAGSLEPSLRASAKDPATVIRAVR